MTFYLKDLDQNTVAVGNKKPLEFGSLLQIYDMFGGLMGTIQHVIQNPLVNPI